MVRNMWQHISLYSVSFRDIATSLPEHNCLKTGFLSVAKFQ